MKTTIPLELLSCLTLSRLLKTVFESLKHVYENIQLFCWTDSMNYLYWFKSTERVWERFVQNRVKEIRDNLPVKE